VKLSTDSNPDVVLVAGGNTLIISNKDGVIFKHTLCGGTIDFYSHEAGHDLGWMQTCKCKRSPYDTVPLTPDQLPPDLQTSDLAPFEMPADVRRFIERRDEA